MNEAFFVEYKPTLKERFWRWAGFKYHLGDEPDDTDGMIGWQCTETRINFGVMDRLRMLATGRLHIKTVQHTDAPSPSVIKTRLDWHILPPGQRN